MIFKSHIILAIFTKNTRKQQFAAVTQKEWKEMEKMFFSAKFSVQERNASFTFEAFQAIPISNMKREILFLFSSWRSKDLPE